MLITAFTPKVQADSESLPIDSEAVVLMDAKSGQVLYGENADQRMYPASITKIATAIYAIENSDLNEIVTISENARNTEGTKVFLEMGEKVTVEKLLVGMLVNSGNDAAVAIAEHIDGTVETFSENLNQFLKEKIGTTSTNFVNPNGLFDENHYTTARDMAKITRYAMGNLTFQKIFQVKEYDWDGETWDTQLVTHHRLLKGEYPYEGITGGKNGYVPEARHTLVTTATRDNLDLIAVTLSAVDGNIPYTDTIELLDYGFNNFKTMFVEKGTSFEAEGTQYSAPNDFYYSVPQNAGYTEEVSESGMFIVKGSNGEELVSYLLDPETVEVAKAEETGKTVQSSERSLTEDLTASVPVLGTMVVGLGIVWFVIRYRKWANNQY